ncbi:glyoxylate/hydroxypyruvate reductase [Tenacibaculum sp. 190524A02b]|uniref:Glyoxylate/hydroxypyruvate reductase n=1 Tax=Tenacibaculum vairaonense TaxID=3137860 RepID=A0ABM9PR25_9FLAO
MSIAIIFNQMNPYPWKESLVEKLKNTSVEIYPNIENKNNIDFIICWKPNINITKEFPNIKVIHSAGAGVDHILQTQKLNTSVAIARIVDESLPKDMFEFVLTSILYKMKNFETYTTNKYKQTWKQFRYTPTQETTVTVLGLGNIGKYVAEKLADFGFIVKGWSNSFKKITCVETSYGKSGMENSIKGADFLVNLLPLTTKTTGILNKQTLRLLNKKGVLINAGRGHHLIENDLIDLLDTNHLSGAILDVFRKEPLPKEHPFWKHPKITITPHIASLTTKESAINLVLDNYNRFQNNQPLLHTISHTKGY